MEGKTIYESSYKELQRITKALSNNKLEIDFDKLDSKTTGEIKSALVQIIADRKRDVFAVITSTN